MTSDAVEKVTAFITRGVGVARELLVFAHPTAGIQVPAGTIEPGERAEAAVLRETLEESGLEAVRIVAALGTRATELPPGRGIVTSTAPIYERPELDAPTAALVPLRGWPIAVEGTDEGGWTRVVYEDEDINVTPTRLLERHAGWMPSGCVGARVVRHFYHLALTAPAAERWEHLAEGRHLFRFFWTPLIPRPRLVAAQDSWLDAVYGELKREP